MQKSWLLVIALAGCITSSDTSPHLAVEYAEAGPYKQVRILEAEGLYWEDIDVEGCQKPREAGPVQAGDVMTCDAPVRISQGGQTLYSHP